jgi:hypothetical protein
VFETSSTRIRSTLHSWLLQAPELREPTSAGYKIVWGLVVWKKNENIESGRNKWIKCKKEEI